MCMCFTLVYGQDRGLEHAIRNTPGSNLTTEGFSYPTFFDGETHSNFTATYEMDTNFLIELQGYYDTYLLANVFRVPVRAKWYVSDRLYLFSGLEMEVELDKYGLKPPPPRLKLINGMGYDVDKNFSIQATHDLQFNTSNFGNYATPNLFSLSGKYKF